MKNTDKAEQQTGGGKASRVATTTLTRHDWNGQFDSIKWAFEEHVKTADRGEYNFAVLYGNEDCPEQIDFYKFESPNWNTPEDYTWRNV
jgi:hypothetical protein